MAKSVSNRKKKNPSAKALASTSTLRIGQVPRPTTDGDTAPDLEAQLLEQFVVSESVAGAQDAQAEAIRHVVTSTPPHDAASLATS